MGSSYRTDDIRAYFARSERKRQDRAEALAAVEDFNARIAAGKIAWALPTIGAALASKHHWLIIECNSCGTIIDLDLKMKPRHPDTSIRVALNDVRCPRCNGHGRPQIMKLSEGPSPATTLGWRE